MSQESFPKMVQGTARGSLILIIGQMITGFISTITIIWMARVLGPTSYGEYTLALLPVSIAMLFQDLGMNQSLTRFSAMYRFEKRKELKMVVWTGLIFSLLTALIISILLYVFAGQIATYFLKRPELESLVKVAAFAVMGNGGIQSTIGAIFIGFEIMGLRSLMQVLFSSLRAILAVTLIVLGLGVFGAVTSYSAALLISGVIGFILFIKFVKFEPGQKGTFNLATLKTLLNYGFPLSLGAILGGALTQLNTILLAYYVATDLIGNYGATVNFGIILSFIMAPISSALLPFFSKFKREDSRLKTIFNLSVKYTAIVSLPAVLLLIALSSPLSKVIYGESYPYVAIYLSLYLLLDAFEGLGGITLTNLISGIGETRILLRTSVINLVIGAILAILLVPRYQVIGLLVAMIITPLFGWAYSTLWVKKNLKFTVNWSTSARIYLTGFSAFIPTYLIANYLKLGTWVTIILGGIVFITIYFIGLPLSGALKRQDFEQLNETAATTGSLSKILKIVLTIMGRLATN